MASEAEPGPHGVNGTLTAWQIACPEICGYPGGSRRVGVECTRGFAEVQRGREGVLNEGLGCVCILS